MVFYDTQPSQDQQSQVCNPTPAHEPIATKKTTPKKTKFAKKEKETHGA